MPTKSTHANPRVQIAPVTSAHLPQVVELINAHLGLLVPGWALTESFVASHLEENPGQAITDPWVSARLTLCARQGQRVVAAAHLLCYGTGPDVGPAMSGTGEIAWFVAWPDAHQAMASLLAAAHAQMGVWDITREAAWDTGLPVGPFVGVPDVWPHLAEALSAAGFHPRAGGDEVVCGGALDTIPPPGAPPVPGLTIQRRLLSTLWAAHEFRFAALHDGQEIGKCEVAVDLSDGGTLPALHNWSALTELQIAEPWRNQGVGTWLVRHAVAWLRLAGRSRLVVAAMADNAGAIRFYARCGWPVLVREQKGWQLVVPAPRADQPPARC